MLIKIANKLFELYNAKYSNFSGTDYILLRKIKKEDQLDFIRKEHNKEQYWEIHLNPTQYVRPPGRSAAGDYEKFVSYVL